MQGGPYLFHSGCLLVCLSACLPACMSVRLSACLSVWACPLCISLHGLTAVAEMWPAGMPGAIVYCMMFSFLVFSYYTQVHNSRITYMLVFPEKRKKESDRTHRAVNHLRLTTAGPNYSRIGGVAGRVTAAPRLSGGTGWATHGVLFAHPRFQPQPEPDHSR